MKYEMLEISKTFPDLIALLNLDYFIYPGFSKM